MVELKDLPEDLLIEILVRLPLKFLGSNLKCVSRHWKALISHRRFAKTLVERYPKPKHTLLLSYGDGVGIILGNSVCDHTKPQFLACDFFAKFVVVGTCHGLICFVNRLTYRACVWNPLLNQWRMFDFHEPRGDKSHESNFIGFGFDTTNDDYKVVKINTGDSEVEVCWMIEICQLRNTETRVISIPTVEVPFQLGYFEPVTVNGSSHWIALHTKNQILQIVMFDMYREKFVEIPFSKDMPNITDDSVDVGTIEPNELEKSALFGMGINGKYFRLGVCKGSLCLFVISDSSKVEAWLMSYQNHDDDSNVVWTRIFEIQVSPDMDVISGFAANDEVVIRNRPKGDYYFYDPWMKTSIYPSRCYCSHVYFAVAYVESLVSVWPQ